MTELTKLLSETAAIRYLGRGRKFFKSAVKNKEIGFKEINGRKYYTTQELDRWLNALTHHTDFTPEARPTTHISRSELSADKEYSLENLLAQRTEEKRNNTALKGSANCNIERNARKKAS